MVATWGAIASAQTNSFVGTADAFWDEARFWSLATPPSISQSAILITNEVSKTVTIDSITANNFPETLTISNLTISANSGYTNVLALTNTGTTTPLYVVTGLAIEGGGGIAISEAALVVDGTFGTFGQVIASNSFIQAGAIAIGDNYSEGAMTVDGGTMTTTSGGLLIAACQQCSQGYLIVSGEGVLNITNGDTYLGNVGAYNHGTLTISNSTFFAAQVLLGQGFRCVGNFNIVGGTVTLNGALITSEEYGGQSAGYVFLNGGKLIVTNADTWIPAGDHGSSSMTVADGLFETRNLYLSTPTLGGGRLIIHGGTVQVDDAIQIGDGYLGSISIDNGHLIATNGTTSASTFPDVPDCSGLPVIPCIYPALISISGGDVIMNRIELARFGFVNTGGMLMITGGSVKVSDGIVLGDCNAEANGYPVDRVGYIWMDGGELDVTNDTGSAFIDIQRGELILSNGTLRVDKLVMTNGCGTFVHAGGTLSVGQLVLDPNDFRIISVAREGNDVRVTWLLGPGITNALQATTGAADGSFNTNGFSDIFIVTNVTTIGTVTNYLDVGAATNAASRFYRARLAL